MFVCCEFYVYCQVEVSATSWSLAQRSPTNCVASLCVIEKPREWGSPGPPGGCHPKKQTTSATYVYWNVQHLDSWIKSDKLDVTCFFIALFHAQHVSDVNTSILRSLRLICWVISWVVLLWYDAWWCYGVVWLGWCGIRMQASACSLAAGSSLVWQIPDAVCTVLSSWWWTENPYETCRASYKNK